MKHPRTVAAVALLLAACSDNPVAPVAEKSGFAPSANRSFSVASGSESTDVDLALADVCDRLVPLLTDASAAGQIAQLIADAKVSVEAGDVAAANRLLVEAQRAADPNADGTPANLGDPADLAVLRLTLENLVAATGS
jgi:hypothetical protein